MLTRAVPFCLVASLLLSPSSATAQDLFSDLISTPGSRLFPPAAVKDRVSEKDNKRYVTVIPGDTFASLAKALYGDESCWKLLWWGNKAKLPNPNDPNALFLPGERQKTFVVPPRSHVNPVYTLNLTGPEQIGEKEAKVILQAMGLMNGDRSFQKAIKGLKYGYTYVNKSGTFNAEVKGYLFREYTLLKKALDRYGDHPTISAEETPELFDKWMKAAAGKLTALPVKQRYALMKSLMTQETGKTHWVDFTPVMGSSADTGFGQFIPATAMAVGINPYDPAENIAGIAIHLNGLIRSFGLKEALARYNGGNEPPAVSYRYASSIMSRMQRYMK
ncbi:MAG: lytic transglycosylase domain-containing protein [Candidatus Riflebacteria bacterium]|nr:lytic transglycosylase domain-containing protein [Candidatus Riflebacteria bacterium]